jgi:hypothetical protein
MKLTKIKSIKSIGIHPTFDVSFATNGGDANNLALDHSYVANNFILHNSSGDARS